ncbi:MAG: hypothetical protein J5899_03430 [Acidaminococcaceae bacterium]|nr:hypothetical protein [Acidaminococcaceae bacterium]
MAKKKICVPELLGSLPFQCRENLLTFQYMKRQAGNEEEKLQGVIRLYCYIRVLTETKIISEADEKEMTKYFTPELAAGQEVTQEENTSKNIMEFLNLLGM